MELIASSAPIEKGQCVYYAWVERIGALLLFIENLFHIPFLQFLKYYIKIQEGIVDVLSNGCADGTLFLSPGFNVGTSQEILPLSFIQDTTLPACLNQLLMLYHKNIHYGECYIYMAVHAFRMDVTSIGPVESHVRDQLAEYRDRKGYPNYNEALQALLEENIKQ